MVTPANTAIYKQNDVKIGNSNESKLRLFTNKLSAAIYKLSIHLAAYQFLMKVSL